jgi:cytosine/adenosine deaminase-related metal-dependent hydrolase
MILRAKYVLPVNAPPIENGVVEVVGNRIAAVGRFAGIADRDLGEVVLLPGLINAHCHLDYTDMCGQLPWRGEFMDWIHRITALKKTWSAEQYRQSIRHGLAEALATGTTTLVNAGGSGETVAESLCRVWWCVELIDLVWSEESRQKVEAAAEWVAGHQPAGLAPHAPYTVSDQLYRLATKLAREHGWLLTTHVAESRDEDRRWHAALGPNCLAAHANWITDAEAAEMARTKTSVVHCPRAHRFFERPTAPVELWRRHGVNVCLGTDSLASNESLDLRAELREMARAWPQVPATEIVRMVTVNPARVLSQNGRGREAALTQGNGRSRLETAPTMTAATTGTLEVGARADLIAVPVTGDPYASVVTGNGAVNFVMAEGNVAVG